MANGGTKMECSEGWRHSDVSNSSALLGMKVKAFGGKAVLRLLRTFLNRVGSSIQHCQVVDFDG
jgi:hypothetical protein